MLMAAGMVPVKLCVSPSVRVIGKPLLFVYVCVKEFAYLYVTVLDGEKMLYADDVVPMAVTIRVESQITPAHAHQPVDTVVG